MRTTTVSTFAVTVAALTLVVGFALQSGRAQTNGGGDEPGTGEAHFPVLGLTRSDQARAHVVNLSTDMKGPALRFSIAFLDERGVAFKPQWDCEVGPGESCSAVLTSAECGPGLDKPARCEFRTQIVAEPLPASRDAVAELWSANVEVIDARGATVVNAGPTAILKYPRGTFTPGTDENGTDDGGTDFPHSDDGTDGGTDFPSSDDGTDFAGSDFGGTDSDGTDTGQ